MPDQSIIVNGPQTGGAKIRAARATNGSFAIVYSPFGESFTVDTAIIKAARVKEIWYDPRYGVAYEFHTQRQHRLSYQTYAPPTSGQRARLGARSRGCRCRIQAALSATSLPAGRSLRHSAQWPARHATRVKPRIRNAAMANCARGPWPQYTTIGSSGRTASDDARQGTAQNGMLTDPGNVAGGELGGRAHVEHERRLAALDSAE